MYYIIAVFSLFFLLKESHSKNSVASMLFILLVLFMGIFRDTTIGTDIALDGGYHDIWVNPFRGLDYVEPGFPYIVAFIKSIIPSYYFFYGFFFLLNVFTYCRVAKYMNAERCVVLSVLFLSFYLCLSFNILRQMTGLSFACLAFYYFVKQGKNIKNYIYYEISILVIVLLFHRSLAILAIAPLFEIEFIRKKLDNELILWGVFFGALLFSTIARNYIDAVMMMAEGVFGNRADFYVEQYQKYSDFAERSHGIMTNLISGTLYIFISRGRRDSTFFIGFFGLLLSVIAGSMLGTIGRIFTNLTVFMILYWGCYWFEFSKDQRLFSLTNVAKCLRILFWLTSLYNTLFTNEAMSPYKTYLF